MKMAKELLNSAQEQLIIICAVAISRFEQRIRNWIRWKGTWPIIPRNPLVFFVHLLSS